VSEIKYEIQTDPKGLAKKIVGSLEETVRCPYDSVAGTSRII